MKKKIDLICGAIFPSNEGKAEVLDVPFDEEARTDIFNILKDQFLDFDKKQKIKFDGRYKADSDESLFISDYEDPDGAMKEIVEMTQGKTFNSINNFSQLKSCVGLLFWVPEITNKILVQKFRPSLLMTPGRGWLWSDTNKTVHGLKESMLTLPSSLAATYDPASKQFVFSNVNTIRGALPKFDAVYAPGATKKQLNEFFSNPIFEQESAKVAMNSDSKQISRLVWLVLHNEISIEVRMKDLKYYDDKLNLNVVDESLIVFPKAVDKAKILLRIILSDVFESDNQVYLTNSKRPLEAFR